MVFGMGKEADKCYSWLAKKLADDVLDSKKNFLFDDEIKHYVHSWKSID